MRLWVECWSVYIRRVSADIDVPLFLPVYGQRRLYDLRKIARREEAEGFSMQGQMNFDSGWEWGYWLNDVVTARASWSPLLHIQDQWDAYQESLRPFLSLYPAAVGEELGHILVGLTQMQDQLLILGNVTYADCDPAAGAACGMQDSPADPQSCPADCHTTSNSAGYTSTTRTGAGTGDSEPGQSRYSSKISGMAYLQGADTWIDLPRLLGLSLLQPDKVHLREAEDPDWVHVLPLLREMEAAVGEWTARMRSLLLLSLDLVPRPGDSATREDRPITSGTLELLVEVWDALQMLSLRVSQVRMLYQSRDRRSSPTPEMVAALQTQARGKIAQAAVIVRQRESLYRVHWERVAGECV